MRQYIIQHDHGHGTTMYYVQSARELTIEDAEAHVGDEYEPDEFETLELHLVDEWETIA